MLKKTLLFTTGLIIVFLSSTLTRVDRTPYKKLDFYKKSINEINQLLTKNHSPSIGDTLLIGFAQVNLTPSDLAPLAGYGNRRPKEMTGVHDSIYVNTTVIYNGKNKIAIVSADLLIIPPQVTALLRFYPPRGQRSIEFQRTRARARSHPSGQAHQHGQASVHAVPRT